MNVCAATSAGCVARRRALSLMIGAVAVSAMSGCGLLNSNKERRVREYLLGLKGVDSVDVYVELLGDQGYRWTVRVRLSDDPPQDALITVVGESFDKVAEIAESQTVDMEVAWVQGSTGVRWSSKAMDATKAVETVAGLCTPAVDGIEVDSGGALVRYRAVDSFPDNWMVPPSSDALSLSHRDFEQHIRIGGLSVSTRYTGHADLSSVPLERVFEAMSPTDRNREGASIELDDMDFVHGQVQLRVAAFGSYEDGLDSDAAARVLAVVLGNRVLQGVELSTAWDESGSDEVRFDMKDGSVVGEGRPPEKGAVILAAAQ